MLGVALAPHAAAVEPGEILKDPSLEARARALSAELRCVVCQNQSIDDSDAPLAADLRRLVRDRLRAGDSDQQVKAYIVARYGTFVLLKPPFAPNTILLWLLPFIIGLAAVFGTYRWLHNRRNDTDVKPQPEDLTDEEQQRLQDVLKSSD
ncbi:MAG: cytochrome c-type biogenesis protein CcmH [Alphaproteobacteria bacterium]|nr:cytochrome c-type biogenesis protein CcmH [Alphaproteobacteria bacterium]